MTIWAFTFYNGFIREDSNSGKVWYLDKDLTEELLIMDLSLNIGDSFTINTAHGDEYAVVDSINNVGGNKRVFLHYCGKWNSPTYRNEDFVFIEGIGPSAGVIFQYDNIHNVWHSGTYLLCAYKDFAQSYYISI